MVLSSVENGKVKDSLNNMDKGRFYKSLTIAFVIVISAMLWSAALLSFLTSCSSSKDLSEVRKATDTKIEVLDKCESFSSQYDILKMLAFDSLVIKDFRVKNFREGDSVHSETAQSSLTLYGLRMTEKESGNNDEDLSLSRFDGENHHETDSTKSSSHKQALSPSDMAEGIKTSSIWICVTVLVIILCLYLRTRLKRFKVGK